jgi:hypothetical protein
MQLEVKPEDKDYSIWSIAGLFAAAGALVAICIVGSAISPPLWDFVCRHYDVLIVFCPPSFVSMALEGSRGMGVVVFVWTIITVANSALYFVVGLILAILWKAFNYTPRDGE